MMIKRVLFIHGAGEGAYEEDLLLAHRIQNDLGPGYDVYAPRMPDETNAPYELWKQQIKEEVLKSREPVILIGHSIGASHLLKALAEVDIRTPVAGVFLLAAPYWGGEGWRYEGYEQLELPADIASRLPRRAKIFFYHARDDEIVPFKHLGLYTNILPSAIAREIEAGGHQLADSSVVAKDIRRLP